MVKVALSSPVGSGTMLTNRSGLRLGFWAVTLVFCLQMVFTAFAQLKIPQVAQEFAHLGFPDYFRVELSWAKLIGIAVIVAPAPVRVKEWAYAGFAITLVSAVIAHLAVKEGPSAYGWAVGTGFLWGASYFLWRRIQGLSLGIEQKTTQN